MTAALVPDFSITVSQRRWACVLDPTLALSMYGLPLVKQLGELIELWIVRELWHILDNTQFYLRQPELILGAQAATLSPQHQQARTQQIVQSLKEWDRLRTTSDRSSWNVHFLADVLGESCLPPSLDADILWRWESLAQSLDTHLESSFATTDTLTLAFRDLAALAAARPACILTYRSADGAPSICTTLERWGIPCQAVAATNAIATLERSQFCHLLVQAGLSKLLWAGLDLVILHLVVPAAATLGTTTAWTEDLPLVDLSTESPVDEINLWQSAQGFWYSIQ